MKAIKGDFIGITELQKYLNISLAKIYKLIQNDNLPCYRFGSRNYKFRIVEIDKYIESKKLQ
jgi:excisionase family DNA binding protein